MEVVYLTRIADVKRNKKKIEKDFFVKLEIIGRRVMIEGESLEEFAALQFLEAVNFGFSVKRASLLKDENFVFRKMHIKSYTRRNLRDVKSRIIGKMGKTRKVLSDISGCGIVVNGGEVGIIGDVETIDSVEAAVKHLIEGAKQANIYRYLERTNREKKKDEAIF